ncbi:hypothetical protein AAE478_008211 [Parahypoxylon ruwenzoriense]
MSLRHIAIPSWPRRTPPKFPTYALATRVQAKLQQDLLAWKSAAVLAAGSPSLASALPPPPPPTLISFTPTPTYTLGRRQTEPLTTPQLNRLRMPLRGVFTPAVARAPRGGLTTYHGPGQAVLWPVVDLRSPLYSYFLVSDYVCLLEKATIATLRKLFGLNGLTSSEHRGVWVNSTNMDPPPCDAKEQGGEEREKEENGDERKIAAVGVHLRRHVTGLGTAVNLTMPVVGPEDVNPWGRIIACGIIGKEVTSVAAQLQRLGRPYEAGMTTKDFSSAWAVEFAARLYNHNPNAKSCSATATTTAAIATTVDQVDWEQWKEETQFNEEGDETYDWEATERRSPRRSPW